MKILCLFLALSTQAATPQWFFMVNFRSWKGVDDLHTYGPFQSRSLCVTAGHALYPANREFMTADEIEAQKASAAKDAAEFKTRVVNAWIKNGKKAGSMPTDSCSGVSFDDQGEVRGGYTRCATLGEPSPTPVVLAGGCIKDKL